MGRLSRLVKAVQTEDAGAGGGWRGTASESMSRWNNAFGRTSGSESKPRPRLSSESAPSKPKESGSGRSLLTPNHASFVRLLEAMRSDAPGGWTDDRYEQTLRQFVGITYVAIHRLATQMSRAEFQVFRDDPDHPEGKRPVHRKDEAYEIVQLLKRPNSKDSFGKLMYRWCQQKMLTGTALTWKVYNVFKRPYELYSIPTALAIPQAANNPEYPEGYYRVQPIYPYGPYSTYPGSQGTSVGAPLDARWMMKFTYPHPLLHYEGYSPLTAMRLHVDAINMVDRARHYMMRRGMFPNAVLNSTDVEGSEELTEDQIDDIRGHFENDHMGPENWGRLFIAYAGWRLEKWGDPPSEMAFEGGWDQLSSFILGGGFGITKPAAGMIEESSYGGLFATMKQLHLTTLEPECESISADLTREICPHWGDDLSIQVRLPRIDDHEIKFTKLDKAVQGKCITKNELRLELGFSLTEEEWGEDFAGTDPQEQQQGMPGAPGAPGAPGDAGGGIEDPDDPMSQLAALANEEPSDLNSPDTGTLGQNSQGVEPGSEVGLGTKALSNGNGHSNGNGNGRLAKYFGNGHEEPPPKRVRLNAYRTVMEVLRNGA